MIDYMLTPTPDIPNNSWIILLEGDSSCHVTCVHLPPHMNIQLAKLHIHVFFRATYGFEVKVFRNISGVEATNFPSQLQVYMCCRPRTSLPYTFISAYTFNIMPLICGCVFFGCDACACIMFVRATHIEQANLILTSVTPTLRRNWASSGRGK